MSKKIKSKLDFDLSPTLVAVVKGNWMRLPEEYNKEFYALVDRANKNIVKI